MNNSHTTRHLPKATLAGLAVGGFTFGVVTFLAASAWGTATAIPAPTTPPVPAAKTVSVTPAVPAAKTVSVAPASTATIVTNNWRHHAESWSSELPSWLSGHRADHQAVPTVLSSNWAGPVLTGGTYNQVVTTFVVPRASCSKQNTDSSFWAGLDGAGSSDTVEQAGVRVTCVSRSAQYVPWVEEYPAPESDIDPAQFTVAPGDKVRVTVTAKSTTDTYSFDDITSGATFTTSAAAPQGATNDSAECVAEAPTGPKGIEKLTNFGTVTFSQCTAGVVTPVAVKSCQVVTEHGCPTGSQLTYSNIGSRKLFSTKYKAKTMSTTGGGFTVTWHHS